MNPVLLLNATLMIPAVVIRPSLDDIQEALINVGKTIAGVSRGVAQWECDDKKSSDGVINIFSFFCQRKYYL